MQKLLYQINKEAQKVFKELPKNVPIGMEELLKIADLQIPPDTDMESDVLRLDAVEISTLTGFGRIVRRALAELTTPEERVNYLYDLMDQTLEHGFLERPNPKPTCKRGCSACCHWVVRISDDEAAVLSPYVKEEHLERLRIQATETHPEGFSIVPQEHRTCIFLNEKRECGIYEQRPLACRKFYVHNDPKDCGINAAQIQAIVHNLPEVIFSVVTEGDTDHLAKKLLEKRGERVERTDRYLEESARYRDGHAHFGASSDSR